MKLCGARYKFGAEINSEGFGKMSKKSEEEGTFKRTKCILLLHLDQILLYI